MSALSQFCKLLFTIADFSWNQKISFSPFSKLHALFFRQIRKKAIRPARKWKPARSSLAASLTLHYHRETVASTACHSALPGAAAFPGFFFFFLCHHFFSHPLQDAPKRMPSTVSHLWNLLPTACITGRWGGIDSPDSHVEERGGQSPGHGARGSRFKLCHCQSLNCVIPRKPLSPSRPWFPLRSYRDDSKSTLGIELSWELREVIYKNHLECIKRFRCMLFFSFRQTQD